MARIITFSQAINEALFEEMERDKKIIVMGEDIGIFGGVYKVTAGLYEKFGPERVIDTPISEDGFIGAAIGMALMGLRPIVEIMYPDFLPNAMNQLINVAAKVKYMFGGNVSAPIIVRTAIIQGRYSGADHSQVLIPIFMHVPGFQVLAPSTPYDAKGLLKAAIRSEKLTIFFEAASLYHIKGEVPENDYLVPLGKADIKKEGDDITIVSFSTTLHTTLSVANKLQKEGISIEVIDLKTLNPLDKETILNSVKKTGRLIIVENSWGVCGVGSEIATIVVEEIMEYLQGPVIRVSPSYTPEPMSPALVKHFLVDEEKIIDAVRRVLKKRTVI
ncbi:MAG: alpha-ketoacid dehydrogenase subunit beta [Candidatus Methanomethylicia archaeon]